LAVLPFFSCCRGMWRTAHSPAGRAASLALRPVGMPGWQITLIAAAAAVLAAAVLAMVLDRARAARRQLTAPRA
jgi:hypothetical protein